MTKAIVAVIETNNNYYANRMVIDCGMRTGKDAATFAKIETLLDITEGYIDEEEQDRYNKMKDEDLIAELSSVAEFQIVVVTAIIDDNGNIDTEI